MRIEIDPTHGDLIQKAIAAGRASDPQAYLQSLIDQDTADRWVTENHAELESLLTDRLDQPSTEREPGDLATLRQRVLEHLTQRPKSSDA
jgi:hypothetical protein